MATGKLGAWAVRERTPSRRYGDLMYQSVARHLGFLSNSINRDIKWPAGPVEGPVAEYSAINSFF